MQSGDPKPVAMLTIDGRVRRAMCSACKEPLPLGDEVGSIDDQKLKMEEAFRRHMRFRHLMSPYPHEPSG